ncbi:uncharacterized protein NECHADRAFT_78102 [Fusarium vanettenii 77-13-4]|uniref:Uncharacterized protein n=1 Tax=Fusarium vanettenii (strain ATCC MYA-4622 / CBS 123669 / FGSC 9596 / NRRL 45880 / 77-13-4) TaxID=660122 RepID=C7YN44_FUSV7|nr:uncharacterized protein NECHADRAFT_78102 [Fusarium vanettenii 77-13-4]EEU47557.1 predicted protein [Fusarium vanettenii 77-13-4]
MYQHLRLTWTNFDYCWSSRIAVLAAPVSHGISSSPDLSSSHLSSPPGDTRYGIPAMYNRNQSQHQNPQDIPIFVDNTATPAGPGAHCFPGYDAIDAASDLTICQVWNPTSERKYLRWLHLGRHPLTRIVRQVECLDVTFRSEAVRWIHFPDRMALKGAELTIRTVDLLIDPRRGNILYRDYWDDMHLADWMSRQPKEPECLSTLSTTEPQEETSLTVRQRVAVETTGKYVVAFKNAITTKRKERTQLEL